MRIRAKHAKELRRGIKFGKKWVGIYNRTKLPSERYVLISSLYWFLRYESPLTGYAADCYVSDHAHHSTVARLEQLGVLG